MDGVGVFKGEREGNALVLGVPLTLLDAEHVVDADVEGLELGALLTLRVPELESVMDDVMLQVAVMLALVVDEGEGVADDDEVAVGLPLALLEEVLVTDAVGVCVADGVWLPLPVDDCEAVGEVVAVVDGVILDVLVPVLVADAVAEGEAVGGVSAINRTRLLYQSATYTSSPLLLGLFNAETPNGSQSWAAVAALPSPL